MKGRLVVEAPQVRLRSIGPADLEDLRLWKNANARWFFHKDEITPEQQRRWFEGYLGRPDDHMFVVEAGGLRAGCLGWRLEADGSADCYNIIASPAGKGKGLLKPAMAALCAHIRAQGAASAHLTIVKDNPAKGFYEKCGFRAVKSDERGELMELDPAYALPKIETRRYFETPVELASLERGRGNARELEPGSELVLYRAAEGVRAFRDLCPHMGARMSEGKWDERAGRASCPWHGYEFDAATGKLARNPNAELFSCMHGLYESYKPERRAELKWAPLDCEVEGGLVWVRKP